MPLRARQDGKDIFAYEYDAPSWDAFKLTSKGTELIMPCCEVRAVPKTSKLGNFFFAHRRKGDCTSTAESQEHLFLRALVARSAINAGWTVKTEWPGESPSGEKWIADVYCTRGSAKVVIEIQFSRQSLQITQARQERYKESGVRCAWIGSDRAFKDNCIPVSKELPFFTVCSPTVGSDPQVNSFNVPLSEFVIGMLCGNLNWKEEPWKYLIIYFDDICWKCGGSVKQVCGHATDWCDEIAQTVPNSSNILEEMRESVINNDALKRLGLNTIGQAKSLKGNAPGFPYCNFCLNCGAPQNNYYLMRKMDSAPVYGLKGVEYISPEKFTGAWEYNGRQN